MKFKIQKDCKKKKGKNGSRLTGKFDILKTFYVTLFPARHWPAVGCTGTLIITS
jgi:hypothetical protein